MGAKPPVMERYRDPVAELTAELVEYRTTEDRPEEIEACIDHVVEFFADLPVTVIRYRHNDVPSVVVGTSETTEPAVCLHGHCDVVPAADRLFEPRFDGDRLAGRGTGDMKGGLAALMYVMDAVATDPDPPDVALMVTSDEERGGRCGTRYLVEDVGYRPEFAITGEPNNVEDYLSVVTKQKGIIHLEVTTTGTRAHAATPDKGENAIAALMEAYPAIQSVFESRGGEWGTTVNYGIVEGGSAANQVPDSARLVLDIRYPSRPRCDSMLTELREIDGITVSSLGSSPPVDTEDTDPYVQALQGAGKTVTGTELPLARKPHASDLRHFVAQDIPGVTFGPEARGSHEPYEHLLLDSLDDYCRILATFLRSVGTD